jgi:hypothetical protein
MRFWAVALIVGMGCEPAERGDTASTGLSGGREEPAASEPAPVLHASDPDAVAALPRAEDAEERKGVPPQELTPFDVAAAKVRFEAGCVLRTAQFPDETNKCLRRPVVVGGCRASQSNGVVYCFKRIEDGALTWNGGWPGDPQADGWTLCDSADAAKGAWPACGD